MLSLQNSISLMTLPKSGNATKLLMKLVSHRYAALDSDNWGFAPAVSSSNSIAVISSTVKLLVDSKNTGGSDIRSARMRLSSSEETGRQDLSNKGFRVLMARFRPVNTSKPNKKNSLDLQIQPFNFLFSKTVPPKTPHIIF